MSHGVSYRNNVYLSQSFTKDRSMDNTTTKDDNADKGMDRTGLRF